jgi:hypothetical protein
VNENIKISIEMANTILNQHMLPYKAQQQNFRQSILSRPDMPSNERNDFIDQDDFVCYYSPEAVSSYSPDANNFPISKHIEIGGKAYKAKEMEMNKQTTFGTGFVADVFLMLDRRVHLTNVRGGFTNIVITYYASIARYHKAQAKRRYIKAGVALHTIVDFYSHSNYIVLYRDYAAEKDTSLKISKIPTFTESMSDPANREFRIVLQNELEMCHVGPGLIGLLIDALSNSETSHKNMTLDSVEKKKGGEKFDENDSDSKINTLANAAGEVAQKELTRIVGGTV